ncbi:MAG TPA: ribosome recycling factor [Candidatus Pacearchaeota archaeon]|nr:ribosome recycling factor [Candidatus Pacearchaeota archaeon]HOU45859.1 ribosome recycling factor [Candidatus Pacearchaeota archaeon]HPM08354.1 ribosome recycling factor [Candidatus Pacearchaeota archaeon]HQI74352.1 ribosome recycling factor [Candidatus Pacearchaeota archaeon]
MNYKDIFTKFKPDLEKNLEFLKNELHKIRTGQANPSLVEDIIVDYMGTMLPVKQLASISVPEPRQILIQPWDRSCLEMIEKAINQAGIAGVQAIVDKDSIRICLPVLTQEYRQELKKEISTRREEARQNLRRIRQDIWKGVESMFSAKQITEDDKFRAKDELQKITDEFNGKIDEACDKKEKEITLN